MATHNRPWDKYYLNNSKEIKPEATLYETYVKCNADNLDGKALYSLLRNKIYTHRELLKYVDDFSASLVKQGLSENSNIGALLSPSLEAATALLASSKIGACIKFIDFSKSPKDVIGNILSANFDVIIVSEVVMELVNHVPNLNSLIIVAEHTGYECRQNQITFDDFLKLGIGQDVKPCEYKKDKASVIIFSSGTTGKPKPIVHSNYSINMAVNKVLLTDLMMERGNSMIWNIPAFIGLGLITTLYSSLIAGVIIIVIENKLPEDCIVKTLAFLEQIDSDKEKLDIDKGAKVNMFTAPFIYRAIADDPNIKDLSYMGGMLAAGSKMEAKELKILNEIYKSKGCELPICNGYGQNEMCGAVTLNSISHNKNGSGGYPTKYTDIRIVDPDTYEDVDEGQDGLILERSESKFMYYDNMPEETKESTIILDDGLSWYNTRDLGHMDSDGFIYITGRTTRVIIVFDSKISIDTVEQKIRTIEGVDECGIFVDFTEDGEKAIAYISLKDGADGDKVKTCIMSEEGIVGPLEKPAEIILIDSMPHLGSGKIDYVTLKEMYNLNK